MCRGTSLGYLPPPSKSSASLGRVTGENLEVGVVKYKKCFHLRASKFHFTKYKKKTFEKIFKKFIFQTRAGKCARWPYILPLKIIEITH